MVSREKMPRNSSARDSMERVKVWRVSGSMGVSRKGMGRPPRGMAGRAAAGWGGLAPGALGGGGGPARGGVGDHAEGGGQADQGAGLEPVVGPVAVAVGLD